MIEDMREDFLEKELDKLCGACPKEHKSDVVILQAEESLGLNQTLPAVYKPPMTYHNPSDSYALTSKECSDRNAQRRELEEMTTTLYAGDPSMVLPTDENGLVKEINLMTSGNSSDSILQIIVPTHELNIINQNNLSQYMSEQAYDSFKQEQ